ncbi:MAG TPA: subclass B3 metallo-beta-lactamase [Sphingobium sp.]
MQNRSTKGAKMPIAAALLMACAGSAPAAPPQEDSLTRPIAPELAPRWMESGGPIRVHGSTWLVGLTHMNIVLIATNAGLVLIDAGLPQAAPLVEQNLRAAGFRIKDVKLILSSEPHYDHAGGIAALARDSGATVLASAAGARVLRVGHSGAEDPQRTTLFAYPSVKRVRTVRDGEHIRLGTLDITAHATPGHTPGSMSWSWRSCAEDGASDCATIVFAASLNSLTDGRYRYSAHPAVVRDFRRSFATLRALPCDILITGHPEHSDGEARLERLRSDPKGMGYRSTNACRTLADRYETALDARLATEAKAAR